MLSLAILLGLALALFSLAFFTKRRFGVLGLSLAAGALLSTNWTGTLTPFIEQQGVSLVVPPLSTVVAAALILAPPLLLLLGGPTYGALWPRLLGSLAFALLAMAFLRVVLGEALNLDGPGEQAYTLLKNYQSTIIVVGLVGAIVDIMFTRNKHGKDKKK